MKKNLIIPAAGRSSRYPGVRPKWLLVNPNGQLMVTEAIKSLDINYFDNIFLTVLKEHLDLYQCRHGIEKQFKKMGVFDKLQLIILNEPTANQPETVAETIIKGKIDGHIYIKDADNQFECNFEPENFVSTFDLNHMATVNASNKSYVQLNEEGLVENIVEKKVINSQFCCGGYSFQSAKQFLEYFERLKSNENLFISHIIYAMLLDKIPFKGNEAKNYIDWGTLEEWKNYKAKYCTLFVDLDGTLVENSGEHFPPFWGETKGIEHNISALRKLYQTGKVKVIITTSRTEEFKEATKTQLEKEGIPYDQIIFDLHHSKRILINDYSKSNPFKSCEAINLKRNSSDLKEMLEESLGFSL